jgi:hypothetical protein
VLRRHSRISKRQTKAASKRLKTEKEGWLGRKAKPSVV